MFKNRPLKKILIPGAPVDLKIIRQT